MDFLISKGLIVMPKVFSVFFLLIFSQAYAAEWEATSFSFGGGVGFAKLSNEALGEGLVYNISAGASVPLLVEGHLRASPVAQLSLIPKEASQIEGRQGGNHVEFSALFLIEHDLKLGTQLIWIGAGPKISSSFIQNHYVWERIGTQLQATELDLEMAVSASMVGQVEVPLNEAFSFVMQAQAPLLSNTYSAITGQVLFRF